MAYRTAHVSTMAMEGEREREREKKKGEEREKEITIQSHYITLHSITFNYIELHDMTQADRNGHASIYISISICLYLYLYLYLSADIYTIDTTLQYIALLCITFHTDRQRERGRGRQIGTQACVQYILVSSMYGVFYVSILIWPCH